MKNPNKNHFSRRDALEAENAQLKLKLELEHKMTESGSGDLPPEVENLWLNSIYKFEQQYANAKRISILDKLGRPHFQKYNEIRPAEVATELDRLYRLLADHQIALDCLCEYEDITIYKFITEELFNEEVDDLKGTDMILHFTYEEFHINHDYEIRRITKDFAESVMRGEWTEFDTLHLNDEIQAGSLILSKASLSVRVLSFQHAYHATQLEEFQITEVKIDESGRQASLKAQLSFKTETHEGEKHSQSCECAFGYAFDTVYWEIRSVQIPGII